MTKAVRFALMALVVLAGAAGAQDDLLSSDPVEYAEVGPELPPDDPAAVVSFGELPAGTTPPAAPAGTVTVFSVPGRFDYPSLARLGAPFLGSADRCTATLIHPQAVLTAAHCVLDQTGRTWPKIKVELRPTRNDARGERQTVTITPATRAIHRDSHTVVAAGGTCHGTPRPAGYLCFSREADLAVIRLNQPVRDAETRVVAMATPDVLRRFTFYAMVGYGYAYVDYESGRLSGNLQLGHFTTSPGPIDITRGSLGARSFSVQGTAVVNGVSHAVALCNGDSGGPFYIADPAAPSRRVLGGVNHAVTRGNSAAECATVGNTSVLVGVAANRGFIDAALEHLGLD